MCDVHVLIKIILLYGLKTGVAYKRHQSWTWLRFSRCVCKHPEGVEGVFGPKRDEVTGKWKTLHNELNDLYSLPNIARVVKLRMRWMGHMARMEKRSLHRVFVGKPEGKSPWGDPDIDGRIILTRIFRKLEGMWGLDGVGSG
jgi:hypothetical protein